MKRDHHDLTKLRILQFLSEPENVQHGETVDYIARAVRDAGGPKSSDTVRARLYEMREEGFIENRDAQPGNSNIRKPYFITRKGREHLAEARNKAIVPAIGQRQDWAARETGEGLQQAAAEFLRRLPEFQLRGEERIQEVSRELAEALSQSTRQPR